MKVSANFKKAQELIDHFVNNGRELSKSELALVAKELDVDLREAMRKLKIARDLALMQRRSNKKRSS